MVASDLPPLSIVSVPFPYVDRLAEKRRPALVISSGKLLDAHGLVWVAMITSAANPRWADDIRVSEHKPCGLPAPSVIRPAKIATIEVSRIANVLGELRGDDRSQVIAYFKAAFAT